MYQNKREERPIILCHKKSFFWQKKIFFCQKKIFNDTSELLSEVGVLDGAVMKKSKKHCTGAPQNHQVTVYAMNWSHLEFIRGISGIPGIPGSGGIDCRSDPPFHTRRGPG